MPPRKGSLKRNMEEQFVNLKQEDMTVTEYFVKFNELAKFAPHRVDTEELKARCFRNGLKSLVLEKLDVL